MKTRGSECVFEVGGSISYQKGENSQQTILWKTACGNSSCNPHMSSIASEFIEQRQAFKNCCFCPLLQCITKIHPQINAYHIVVQINLTAAFSDVFT